MNGILIINKPKGYTSRDIVNIVGKHLNTKKVGHTGTLDPMAEGVLVICIGKALKVCELLTSTTKEYLAGITLGVTTDTLDTEGMVLSTKSVDIEDQELIEKVASFKKTYLQEVPKYSAVKVNGKKLYEYARNNQEVILPKKEVTIHNIDIVSDIIRENNQIKFTIKCTVSKGTYIRSLARDIGESLKCPSLMHSLVRIKQGQFKIEDTITLEDLSKNNYKLLSICEVFPEIPTKNVDDKTLFEVKNGAPINKFVDCEQAFILNNNQELIALYQNNREEARVYKMFTS